MKPSIKFLLFLCIWLQGNQTAVFASSQNGSIVYSKCSQLQQADLEISGLEHHCIFIAPPADLPVENELLVFEEEDNEDEHTRKLKSATEPGYLFFCDCTDAHSCMVLTKSLSFYGNKSHPDQGKYLAFRVLRI